MTQGLEKNTPPKHSGQQADAQAHKSDSLRESIKWLLHMQKIVPSTGT